MYLEHFQQFQVLHGCFSEEKYMSENIRFQKAGKRKLSERAPRSKGALN